MKFEIQTLEMSDGTVITLPNTGVVLFVGPNNAGKSQSLRDIQGLTRSSPEYKGKSIQKLTDAKTGDQQEAVDWAEKNLQRRTANGLSQLHVPGWGDIQSAQQFANQWQQAGLNVLTDTFLLLADGATRLSGTSAPASIDFRTQFPVHPFQRAARYPHLEEQLDSISRSAFGLPLTVDRYAGAVIPVRMGERPKFKQSQGRPSEAYLQALFDLPQLEEQGDGVKSFMGLMSQLVAGNHQVLLVDEPEAFLHPPQARLLGRLLAERASERQVFIATHSADIVQGALEAAQPVTVVRLTRSGGVNGAAVLEHDKLQELWSDPLLRYSDVLTGLFHDAVVLCEGDSDCRYYAAVRDGLFPEDPSSRRPELLFTHCGGKGRLAMVIRALSALRVPVVAVGDLDLLREEADIKRSYLALGGNWDRIKPDRDIVAKSLSADAKALRKTAAKDALEKRLESAGEVLTPRDVEALRSILKSETGWEKAKRAGIAALPQGQATAAAKRLLAEIEAAGLLVVPVGELERFAPEIGGHGPTWISEVLAQSLHLSPAPEARDFVTKIHQLAAKLAGLSLSS